MSANRPNSSTSSNRDLWQEKAVVVVNGRAREEEACDAFMPVVMAAGKLRENKRCN